MLVAMVIIFVRPGLRHDVGFARMLLGVEHLVRQVCLREQAVDDFGVLDRRGAHQHRLAALVALADVLDRRLVLLARRLVDAVELVLALADAVRRNDHGLQTVDLLELVGFGVGGAGHAGQLAVQAEVVLEGDGGERLVLGLDLHAFLGFHGLVQAVAPAPARHQAAGEFVDDDHLTLLHHVMLVTVIQVPCTQRGVQVVHQRDVGRVIERSAFGQQLEFAQQLLGLFVPVFGQEHLVGLFVDREVARHRDAFARARIGLAFLLDEQRHHLVDGQIEVGVVFGLAADDQRGAGLVDQDGVHLVDDGVVQAALNPVAGLVHHVVAQVVEAVFVVGAVGDVAAVGALLFLARHLRQVDTHRQAQEVIKPAHPLGVAAGEVVVHGDHVHAVARQRIQIHRQRGGQRLAFAGAHFGDLSVVKRHAAEQLHVEMAHLHDALGALAHGGKSFGQQGIEGFALGDAVLELQRLGAQPIVAELLELGFERIDALHRLAILLEEPVVATAENLGQEVGCHWRGDGRAPDQAGTATGFPKIW
jgi:hypothetical protein